MRKLTAYKIRSIAENWLRLCLNLKRVPHISLQVQDQFILEGSYFRLGWKTSGAYVLKVFVNDSFRGYFLPQEQISLAAGTSTIVCVQAVGVYGKSDVIFEPVITPFAWTQAAQIKLKRQVLNPPPVYNLPIMHPALQQPITPTPVLVSSQPQVDTAKFRKAKLQLEQEIHDQNKSMTNSL